MAKKLIEGEDKKESILSKITNFFKTQKDASEAKADDEEDATAEEEEPEAKADDEEDTTAEDASAESTDDEDNEDGDDSDEDDVEVNGKTYSLKDPAQAREAIEALQEINAEQNTLLAEAAVELGKTKQEVKQEIKSTFVVPASKRAHKIGTKTDEPALPEGMMPKEGSIAYAAAKDAVARKKAETKKK